MLFFVNCNSLDIPMNNMSKKRSSTPTTHVSGESKLRSVLRSLACAWACEKIPSDLGLGGSFRQVPVLWFPPPVTPG